MAELPPLPSAAEMAEPDLTNREAYFNKLYASSLRASELDKMYACSEEELRNAREKIYKELEGVLGLTVEEMKKLEDDNLPQAERVRLEKKMQDFLLEGVDVEGLEASAAKNEKRLEEISKELAVYEEKEKKGQLTEADKARMQQLSLEMMQMSQEMFGSLGGLVGKAEKAASATSRIMSGVEAELSAFVKKAEQIKYDDGTVAKNCEQIAAEYEKELMSIYRQIWEEEDAKKVHELYDRADEMMKNYRTRAAKIYREGLASRLEKTKALLPEAEKLYASMAEDGYIPQCSMKRAPLNVVVDCIDILESAYNDFPQPKVLPYREKKLDLGLKEGEYILNGESGYSGSYARVGIASSTSGSSVGAMEEDFIKNSTFLVYNEQEKCYYKLNNGARTRLDGDGPFDFHTPQKRESSAYGEIPLRGGGRVANYGREGSLTLHDGTRCFPIAMLRNDAWLEFIEYSGEKGFVLCSYKL